jgi:hypothetical protein
MGNLTAEIEIVNGKHYVGVTSAPEEVVFISRPFDRREEAEEMANAINEGRAKLDFEDQSLARN